MNPERIPAVPKYIVTERIADVPPGHRFSHYFSLCEPGSWKLPSKDKREALAQVAGPLSGVTADMVEQLAARQYATAAMSGSHTIAFTAQLSSPLVTGMGEEHPCENGFAFSLPHGLPVLRGSGIKGVLRRAAEELALFELDSKGWNMVAVWLLFGFDATSSCFAQDDTGEPAGAWANLYRYHIDNGLSDEQARSFLDLCAASSSDVRDDARMGDWQQAPACFMADLAGRQSKALRGSIHYRGGLDCWDLYPVPRQKGAALLFVDVLTPHQADYLQKGTQTPHDSGTPVPCPFLAVEPGSTAGVFAQLKPLATTPGWLLDSWRDLVGAAFDYAGSELGFGAKTAVGYGRMARDQQAEERRAKKTEQQAKERAAEARRAEMSPLDRDIEDIGSGNPDNPALALLTALNEGKWEDPAEKAEVATRALELLERWRETAKLKKMAKQKYEKRKAALEKFAAGNDD